MKKTLIVIDMQNDFVTGSLKNESAQAIIPKIKKKIDEKHQKNLFKLRPIPSFPYKED